MLGYGSEAGGRMPIQGGYSGDGYIIDPSTGQPAVSRINEAVLKEVAEQLGVPYAHRVGTGSSGSPGDGGAGNDEGSEMANSKIDEGLLVSGIEELLEQGSNTRSVYNVQIWPLGLLLVGLIMWEIYAITPRLSAALELRRVTRRNSTAGSSAGMSGSFR